MSDEEYEKMKQFMADQIKEIEIHKWLESEKEGAYYIYVRERRKGNEGIENSRNNPLTPTPYKRIIKI